MFFRNVSIYLPELSTCFVSYRMLLGNAPKQTRLHSKEFTRNNRVIVGNGVFCTGLSIVVISGTK
jgi:hypothetical protein